MTAPHHRSLGCLRSHYRSPDTVLIDLAEMHVIPIGAIVGVCAEAVCHVGARRDRVLMIAMAISLVEWGEMV